jgi:hypothetical protein
VSRCDRPLDPIDVQAVALGAEPVARPDAAEHVRTCPDCAQLVEEASNLSVRIEAIAEPEVPAGLSERILRLRAFSAREKRDLSIWRPSGLLFGGVLASGLLLLALPGLQAEEQVSLSLSAALPAVALVRALVGSAMETLRATPAGLEALSGVLGSSRSLWGPLCLALVAPLALALRRVLARAPRR